MEQLTYSVIVGNVGTVLAGASRERAQETAEEYAAQARAGHMRADWPVTLMSDGPDAEIQQEWDERTDDDA